MWDPVPWLIEGGAQHSGNVARQLAYAAFAGQEGIIGPTDLEVRAMATPGPQLRVYPGSCAIRNRATGIKYEMYVGRNPTEDVKNVSPTDATGPRSDLIVARVENPWLNGEPWADPADPIVGPYIQTAIISNVPNTTTTVTGLGLGYSAIPLARLDLPVSTGTVQQSHLVDLRFMSALLRHDEQWVIPQAAQDTLFEEPFTIWPYSLDLQVRVPEWATKASMHAVITCAKYGPGNTRGDIRFDFGGLKTAVILYDVESTELSRADVHAAGNVNIPASMRGTTQRVFTEARRYVAGVTTNLVAETFTTAVVNIEFTAGPASNV